MKRGFFKPEQTKMPSRTRGHSLSCAACGLYKGCKHPQMDPYGQNQRNIMVIGEAPGQTEDTLGKPFVGKTGKLLQKVFHDNGIDLFRDCIVLNAVNCHPKENDTPTKMQIDCCREIKVRAALEEYTPKAVVLVGGSAVESFLGDRWKRDLHGINTWRGFQIPDQTFRTWVFPIWHPSFVERRERAREVMTIWNQDIRNISDHYDDAFPIFKQPRIIYLEDDLSPLDAIEAGVVSLDWETTGLKPHAPGHRIVSGSVSPDADTAYAFLIPNTQRKRKPLIRLLENNLISKIGHNLKFEQAWSLVRLGVEIKNMAFDSMLAAHLLDNRPNISSLAFQAYLYLGIMEYNDEVEAYLKSTDPKDGNSMNRILELVDHPDDLLKYNALDTVVQYRIAQKQMDLIGYDFLPF